MLKRKEKRIGTLGFMVSRETGAIDGGGGGGGESRREVENR